MVLRIVKNKILQILHLRLESKNYFEDKISIVFTVLLGSFAGAFFGSLFDAIGIGLTRLYFPYREPFDIIMIVLTGFLFPLTLAIYVSILDKSNGLTMLNRVITAILACIFSFVIGIIIFHLWGILIGLLRFIKIILEAIFSLAAYMIFSS